MSRITGGTIYDDECGNIPEHIIRKGKNYYINNIFTGKEGLEERKKELKEIDARFVTIAKICKGKKRYILYDSL